MDQYITGKTDTMSGFGVMFSDENFVLSNIDSQIVAKGLAEGDIIVEIDQQSLSMKNIGQLFGNLKAKTIDDSYTLKVRRGNEELEFTLNKITTPRIEKHLFSVDENATAEQLKLRAAWLQNL